MSYELSICPDYLKVFRENVVDFVSTNRLIDVMKGCIVEPHLTENYQTETSKSTNCK